jgi:hypothetical protein
VTGGGELLPPQAHMTTNPANANVVDRRLRGTITNITPISSNAVGHALDQGDEGRDVPAFRFSDDGLAVVVTVNVEPLIVQEPAGIEQDAEKVGVEGKLVVEICAVAAPPLVAVSVGGVAVTVGGAGAVPVPVSATAPLTFPVMTKLPVKLVALVGAKVTLIEHIWVGARLAGQLFVCVKTASPVTEIEPICRVALPVLYTRTKPTMLLPTVSGLKLNAAGSNTNAGFVGAVADVVAVTNAEALPCSTNGGSEFVTEPSAATINGVTNPGGFVFGGVPL